MPSGKIYRLVFPDGSYYIGSTFLDLEKRLYYHKCKHYTETSRVYAKWREVGRNAVTIELLTEVEGDRLDLETIEDEYLLSCLDDEQCLNKKRAIADRVSYDYAYRNAHAEELAAKQKARRTKLSL